MKNKPILAPIDIDAEYGFLSYLIRWLDTKGGVTVQFGKSGPDYRCLMTYEGRSYETTSNSLFSALKLAAAKHSSDTLWGEDK